jgi:putative FmdB family regulatory protein
MPTYEYVCLKCEKQFDVSQRMSDAPLTECPKDLCPGKKWGKGKVKRSVGGGAGLLFKGSGFYITDYRSSGYKSSAASDSGSGSKSTSASSPKPSST